MVNEIDNSRKIVHLTDFNIPKVEKSVDRLDVQAIEIPKEVSIYGFLLNFFNFNISSFFFNIILGIIR